MRIELEGYKKYSVEISIFNSTIPEYLGSLKEHFNKEPTIFGKEIIYNFKDGSTIITMPSETNLSEIEINTFGCPKKVLNKLDELSKTN